MALSQYKEWYQRHGVNRASALLEADPVIIKNLPVGSTLHYFGDAQAPLPDPTDPLYKGYSTKVMVYSLKNYAGAVAPGGRKKEVQVDREGIEFANRNSSFQYLRNLNLSTVGAQQLLIVNYGYIDQLFLYPDTPVAQFNKFRNKLITFVQTVKELDEDKLRNNFVVFDIPVDLLSKFVLDNFALGEPTKISKIFNTEEKIFLRELWLWANPATRASSVFAALEEKDLRHLNFIHRTLAGEYQVVNFGFLYSWIKGSKNLTFLGTVATVPFTDIQKYWLKNTMSLQSINATGATVSEEEQISAELAAKVMQADKGGPQEGERFPEGSSQANTQVRDQQPAKGRGAAAGPNSPASADAIESTIDTDAQLSQGLKDLDADIAALDAIDKKRYTEDLTVTSPDGGEEILDIRDVKVNVYTSEIPESVESIQAKIFTNRSNLEALKAKIDIHADNGRLSGSDYRKLVTMAEKAPLQPDPYGSNKTIAQAMALTEKDLEITKQEAALVVPPTVLDPSMAGSTLNVLERKYNTNIIYKDMLRSVQAIQKAGIVVRNHEVETKSNILGTYDIHTIELKPIDGQPSIIRARIPRVDDEGFFRAKGNKYVMRKQMVDRPIRRIGTNRVGLTSYYGKSFVDRASKKADSSLEFVFRRLNKATIEPDEWLRDVGPGDVFDNYFEAPYIYNGLASKFRSFRAGAFIFNFNHKDREKAASPELLKKLEVKGRRLVGQGPGSNPIVVDMENNFWLVTPAGEKPIGDIFDILKLDRSSAPVDFAEVKVFSKSIPVGVFIAQQLGFRALVKYLGAKHRLVEGRQQKKMGPFEYAVQFKDVSYIFDRREATASLVLAGFNSFEKELKQYDAEEFDRKTVYMRLLESKGLTSIYEKEMQNLNDLFIDPITEDLLKELNEPQTFMGLLIRSCELLQTYHHPASQDMNFQRFRGYERFAGFMYKEMINSVRAYKAKNSTGRAKVDMSPFAVWATVTRDSSVKHAEDINPIQALKGNEAITYVGEGGRSKESMNKDSRALHKSNLGVVSVDASVDSSDVGINIFTSADPGISSVRGMGKKGRELDPANIFGTSTLLAPFSNHDD